MRLPGQVLHATLQELEFTGLQEQHRRQARPLYCQGLFDAIAVGEIRTELLSRSSSSPPSSVTGFGCVFKPGKCSQMVRAVVHLENPFAPKLLLPG